MDPDTKFPPISQRGSGVIVGTTVLLAICTLTYVLRVYSSRSRKHTHGWRWDLIWVTITYLFGLGGYISLIICVKLGLGNHIETLSLPQIFRAIHWGVISLEVYIVAGACAKLSIVALLISIQGVDAQFRTRFLKFLGIFQAVINVVLVCLIIFECNPIDRLWDPLLPGKCELKNVNQRFSFFQGGKTKLQMRLHRILTDNAIAVSCLTDWILGLWPLTMISQLRISTRSKISFCMLIGVGVIPGIASICRTIVTDKAVNAFDVTYTYPMIMMLTVVEIYLILILGSAPSLRPLFISFFWKEKSDAPRSESLAPTTPRKVASQMFSGRMEEVDVDVLLEEESKGMTVSCTHVVPDEPSAVAKEEA